MKERRRRRMRKWCEGDLLAALRNNVRYEQKQNKIAS